MKLECWALGKPHESFVAEGVKDFTRRIENYYPVEWKIFQPKKMAGNITPEKIKEKEAKAIQAALKEDDWLVSLDEHGRTMTSRKLADFIGDRGNESVRRLIFLIGGAYGIQESLLKRSRFIWSLSSLTFPHQLVRLILAEQLYRDCNIGRNEKYHHD